jgi:hypothetical protein
MKITIISDGRSTRVIDALTGESIENVRSVHFEHQAGSPPIVTVEVLLPSVDLADLPSKFHEVELIHRNGDLSRSPVHES